MMDKFLLAAQIILCLVAVFAILRAKHKTHSIILRLRGMAMGG